MHEHAIDDPRDTQPAVRISARLAVVRGRLVIPGRRRKHDQAVTCLELSATDQSVVSHDAMFASFAKSERTRQPIGCRGGIFVCEHRDDARVEVTQSDVRYRSARTWRTRPAPRLAYPVRCRAPRA